MTKNPERDARVKELKAFCARQLADINRLTTEIHNLNRKIDKLNALKRKAP